MCRVYANKRLLCNCYYSLEALELYYSPRLPIISLAQCFYKDHCLKSVCIRSFSGPYFPAFGLNTGRYCVSLRIQSECGKIWTRETPNTDTFYAMDDFIEVIAIWKLGVARIKETFGMRQLKNKKQSKKLTLSFTLNIQKQWREGVL